jgi:4'-phosphopantetheinyl transferase
MNGKRESSSTETLDPRAVYVHAVDLLQGDPALERFTHVLDPRELLRAERFATQALRRKHVVSHGSLRILLGRYLHIRPSEVRFIYNEHGKPALDPVHASGLRFNLSHSGEKCVVAVTAEREVGVDVELIRKLDNWQNIATRFFSKRETARLSALPESLGTTGFFATWSRKEAFIKALGLGLALDLEAFEVEVDPQLEARLLWTRDDLSRPEAWSMRDIEVDASYRAAVVVEGPELDLHFDMGEQFPTQPEPEARGAA